MLMRAAALLVLSLCAAGSSAAADVQNLSMPLPSGGTLLYGLAAPAASDDRPHPLVLALHPGGVRMRYYGSAYAQAVVIPALPWADAVVVAPDCPAASWTAPEAEAAVMALLERVLREHAIDTRRVAVVGYSMGGRGTWFMAARHRDLFTAAVPMAAAVGDEPPDTLATMPTYIVHSRRDQVVPFGPAEQNAAALARLGRVVKFEALDQPTHYEMVAYVPALRRAFAWVADQWARTSAGGNR